LIRKYVNVTVLAGGPLAWMVNAPGATVAQMRTSGSLDGVNITRLLPLHAVEFTVRLVVPDSKVAVPTEAPSTRMRPAHPSAQPDAAVIYRP
jgi:hypothetical protein